MAEILEGPKEWSRKVQCPHEDCRTHFRIKKEDVKRSTSEDAISFWAACPSCGTFVSLNKLPPVVTGW
ncbi:MAG: hypothetical protein HYV25_02555 [Candidatus Harrisonbacteria bacterium]|nr:hypothetical protein [Candidatus Harrisonbacteria bacterium]